MNNLHKFLLLVLIGLSIVACTFESYKYDDKEQIEHFNFRSTHEFKGELTSYSIFKGEIANLLPQDDFHLLELSSTLFTDYAHKQRLAYVPEGKEIRRLSKEEIDFPDGSILVKTFYYLNDEREPSQGRRIIESRLLVKESGVWNAATYKWNESQSEAVLSTDGSSQLVSWTDMHGIERSTIYNVPEQNECFTCHQSNSATVPLGPTLRNLNRNVTRQGKSIEQIEYLQEIGLLNKFSIEGLSQIVDYRNTTASLSERSRAYLDINCAHCHNPKGWSSAKEMNFDFRYETTLAYTGIVNHEEKIARNLMKGRMPLIGTTMIDNKGVNLIVDYLQSL